MRIRLKRSKNVKNRGFRLDPPFLRELDDFTLDFIGHLVFRKEIVETIPCIVMVPMTIGALRATPGLPGVPPAPGRFPRPPFFERVSRFLIGFHWRGGYRGRWPRSPTPPIFRILTMYRNDPAGHRGPMGYPRAAWEIFPRGKISGREAPAIPLRYMVRVPMTCEDLS